MTETLSSVLPTKQLRELREKLHHLKPVVIIGNHGLTPNVLQEIETALDDHELIKIRVNASNSNNRTDITKQITTATKAALVQTIGHIIAIYRVNSKNDETTA